MREDVLTLTFFQDYIEYARKMYGMKPIKKSYYYRAMDYFREEHSNVVFLWISDDMEWSKKNVKNKNGDIFYVGNIKN